MRTGRLPSSRRLARRQLSAAVAAALLGLSQAAGSAVVVTGPYWMDPWDAAPLNGPTLLKPGTKLWLGAAADGSFSALAGATVELALLSLAQQGSVTTGLLDGAATVMRLTGDGNTNRFEVGNTGVGSFVVSGGALLDGRAEAANCLAGHRYCGNYVGNGAGSTGTFTVTGMGSEARFTSGFVLGGINVNGSFGTPGGTTTAAVQVKDGGLLRTDSLAAGVSGLGPDATGAERSVATVLVQGPGSRWLVEAGVLNGGHPLAEFANGALASITAAIKAGGTLKVLGSPGVDYGMRISQAGGMATVLVSGAGSVLGLEGDADKGYFHIGEWSLSAPSQGSGRLDVRDGGTVLGGRWNQIGFGGQGTLVVTGPGSLVDMSRGDVTVGHSGTGQLEVLDGATMRARQLNVGETWFDPGVARQAGRGEVVLSGAGSSLLLGAIDSHRLIVGGWGQGSLTVSNGALLDAAGDAAACAHRWCVALIGQSPGSDGRFTVTGSGSQARFLGDFNVAFLDVSRPATDGWTHGDLGGVSRGRVEVLDGGLLSTERVNIGGWPKPAGTGGERSFAEVVVSGAGARWDVTGSALEARGASFNVGVSRNTDAQLTVSAGGSLNIAGPTGQGANLDLLMGNSVLHVQGSGSRVRVDSDVDSRLVVGGGAGGTALLRVSDGGSVSQGGGGWSVLNIGEANASGRVEVLSSGSLSGARQINVGHGGAGSLLVSGLGSSVSGFDKQATLALEGNDQATARMAIGEGALVQVGRLRMGADGLGPTSLAIQGADARLVLGGSNTERLNLASGSLIVSGGGVIDARTNLADCEGGVWCASLIGSTAGGNASFTVTGAGSRASFTGHFQAGITGLATPAADGWTLGIPGGRTNARIEVLDGGVIQTDHATFGLGTFSTGATGREGAAVNLAIQGAGSRFEVLGTDALGSYFNTILWNAKNTQVDVSIRDGGVLALSSTKAGTSIALSTLPGTTQLSVSGAGSKLELGNSVGAANQLSAGLNGGTATLSFIEGAVLDGVTRATLGSHGGLANLHVDGAGSRVNFGAAAADLYLGRVGGSGSMTVSGGAIATLDSRLPRLYVADGLGTPGTSGSLHIQGMGSQLLLQSPTSGEGANDLPQANIGWGGTGVVTISDGGELLLNGRGTSTLAQPASTRMTIGQAVSGQTGAGIVNVSRSGSRLRVEGTDPLIIVGRFAGSTGALNFSANAEAHTTTLHVGREGGIGSLSVSQSTLKLDGQFTGGAGRALLALGVGAGSIGAASIAQGSTIEISNPGDRGALLMLGGTDSFAGGNGSLAVNASRIDVVGPAGATAAIVGYNGSGLATLEAGSQLNASGGVIVAWKPESNGILRVSGGSSVNTNYVGVGSSREGEGGVGTLIVNDSSVLTATTIEIGSRGYVGGTGTLVGSVINRGVFNPGSSPGTLRLHGDFENQAGGRLVLEVESDGHGGFVTDQLLFDAGRQLDFNSLQVEFRFLGNTDPNAFQASGAFQIGSFLQQGGTAIESSLLTGTHYSASSQAYQFTSFTFTAEGGAVFQAQAVPEPGTWVMFLAGLLAMGRVAKRRLT